MVAMIGCRASRAPTPPAVTFYATDPVVKRGVALAPLPEHLPVLDLDPDPADWRWPLPGPPQLAPSGDIARMYETTADWSSLCAARRDPKGVDREEALAYLRAWCDLPPDVTLAKALVPLVRARTMAIATAASIDLAVVLSFQLAAGEAMQWLGYRNAREPLVLDALAAAYLSVDRPDDVRATIKVLAASPAYGMLRCRRVFRELFVADRDRRDVIRNQLAASNDAVCGRLSAHAHCTLSWGPQAGGVGAAPARIDLERCTPILLDQPELTPRAYATIAVAHWPADSRSFDDWFSFLTFTVGAIGAPRANELVGAALDNALATSDCDAELRQLQAAFDHVAVLARTLRPLTPATCRQLRSGR